MVCLCQWKAVLFRRWGRLQWALTVLFPHGTLSPGPQATDWLGARLQVPLLKPSLFSFSFFFLVTLPFTWPSPFLFFVTTFILSLPVSLIHTPFFTKATGWWHHEVSVHHLMTHSFNFSCEFKRIYVCVWEREMVCEVWIDVTSEAL